MPSFARDALRAGQGRGRPPPIGWRLQRAFFKPAAATVYRWRGGRFPTRFRFEKRAGDHVFFTVVKIARRRGGIIRIVRIVTEPEIARA
jgi:hypothetical protein